ncbi:MAG TPA: hypothetical protein VF490_08980 [Chryseosolibacter sp.]
MGSEPQSDLAISDSQHEIESKAGGQLPFFFVLQFSLHGDIYLVLSAFAACVLFFRIRRIELNVVPERRFESTDTH